MCRVIYRNDVSESTRVILRIVFDSNMNQYTRAGQLLTAAKEINKNRKTRKSGAAERAETDEIGSKKRTWGDRKSGEFVPGQQRKKCARSGERRSARRSAGSKTNQEESFVEEQQADVSGIMGNETFQVLEQDVPEVQGDLMDSMERMSLDGSHTASTPQHSFSHGIGLLDVSQILADERQNVVDPHSDIYSRPGLLPVQNNTRPKVSCSNFAQVISVAYSTIKFQTEKCYTNNTVAIQARGRLSLLLHNDL